MKNILITLSATALMSWIGVTAQNAHVNLQSNSDCINADYCVTMQIKADDGIDFNMGTSSLFMLYNDKALKFKSYKSLNFDEHNECIENGFQAFDPHKYDADSPGKINTTINLAVSGAKCATIGSEYIDIAEVCFRILDLSKKSNVRFSEKHTHFNLDKDEIQLIENVKYGRLNDKLDCSVTVDYSIEMSVLNNPVGNNAEILISSLINDDLDLKLYDVTGNLVYTKQMEVYENQISDLTLNLEELSPGIYLLVNSNNPRTNELKIVKQ